MALFTKCSAYLNLVDGTLCGSPAVAVDYQRGRGVCLAHLKIWPGTTTIICDPKGICPVRMTSAEVLAQGPNGKHRCEACGRSAKTTDPAHPCVLWRDHLFCRPCLERFELGEVTPWT